MPPRTRRVEALKLIGARGSGTKPVLILLFCTVIGRDRAADRRRGRAQAGWQGPQGAEYVPGPREAGSAGDVVQLAVRFFFVFFDEIIPRTQRL